MDFEYTLEGTKATVTVAGKLLVSNAQSLDDLLNKLSETAVDFVIDVSGLEYISSAGLRTLLIAQKLAMQRGGTLQLLSPNDDVMEILELTGMSDVLAIER